MSWLARLGLSPALARVTPLALVHAERLAAIHAGAFARPWDAHDFETFLLDPAVRADGLFLGRATRPAGFVLSRLTLDEAEILSVALAGPVRGGGHSRTLLAHHVDRLAYAGISRVHLEVEEGNAPALALYRRLGFQPAGIRPGYYARPDGTRAAALSMTRVLTPAAGTVARRG